MSTTVLKERSPSSTDSALTGFGTMLRFASRRERVRMPAWIAALTLLTVSTVAGFPDLYPTAESRQSRAALMDSPAATAMSGPGFGLDNYTFGAMLANEMLSFLAIFVALMSVLMVSRHTRHEEEQGRAELIRAGVVGRHANLSAALAVTVIANLLLAVVLTLVLSGMGIETITWGGSALFAASLAMVGIVFTAASAVSAQVFEHGRAASGMAGALIGVAFALRAAGDMGNAALSWLSPIGWAQRTKVYVDGTAWPLLLGVVVAGVLVAVAFSLSTRRDVGAGLLRPRLGAARASDALSTPLGFALRLHRGAVVGWTSALFLFGAMYGSLASEVEAFVEDNPAMREFIRTMGSASFIQSWLASIMAMLAMVCSVFGVLAIVRMRTEETSGRVEPVLSTALTRVRWVAGHLAVALGGGAVIMLAGGLGLGVSAMASTGESALLPDLLSAALVYIPAVWLTTGLALALFGLLPSAVHATWVVLGYGLFIGMLGPLLRLPGWLNNLSPYSHVPQLPAVDVEVTPLVLLTVVAAGLIALGFVGFRQRDLGSA
ncbi:ABC transporter permease [Haloechinothrix salitolerans]|uniref:ABC transporter permease n=1 Tax=Haloechinothrix salitolerans TaxID=926830 RepID=A0ABW2BT80_9PSEU